MTLDLPLPNNINNKQPSEDLLQLIEDFKGSIVKSKNLFVTIVNRARDEGFNDKEIDSLLYSKLKEIIPRKTLYRYREEFIPLAIDKRNNNNKNNIEKDYIRSESNDTTNEIKSPWKNVTDKVMEMLRTNSPSFPSTKTEDTDDDQTTEDQQTTQNIADVEQEQHQDIITEVKKSQQSTPILATRPNWEIPWYERKTRAEQIEKESYNDSSSDKIRNSVDFYKNTLVEFYRKFWIEINREVRALHRENSKWNINKIVYTIYASHEDTKNYFPFSEGIIKKHLDIENKELFGIYEKDIPL
jgi:hypothetical protein